MDEIYEYRLGFGRRLEWLAAIAAAALLSFAIDNQSPLILGAVWGLCASMIVWFLSQNKVAGIRVDETHLTLAAWRDPKEVPLANIDHFRMTHWTDDSDVVLVYRDGTEEELSASDLPGIQEFSEVMADRGIPVKDPLH